MLEMYSLLRARWPLTQSMFVCLQRAWTAAWMCLCMSRRACLRRTGPQRQPRCQRPSQQRCAAEPRTARQPIQCPLIRAIRAQACRAAVSTCMHGEERPVASQGPVAKQGRHMLRSSIVYTVLQSQGSAAAVLQVIACAGPRKHCCLSSARVDKHAERRMPVLTSCLIACIPACAGPQVLLCVTRAGGQAGGAAHAGADGPVQRAAGAARQVPAADGRAGLRQEGLSGRPHRAHRQGIQVTAPVWRCMRTTWALLESAHACSPHAACPNKRVSRLYMLVHAVQKKSTFQSPNAGR